LGFAQTVFGIGMLTEPIILEDVLRGQEVSEIVTVFNPENGQITYKLGAEGDIGSWVTFFENEQSNTSISEINVPAKSYLDAIAKIRVPLDTPNGEYTGEIFITQAPKDKSEGGENSVTVFQRVGREVKVAVTDKEIIKLDTTLIPEKYDIKIGEPLKIKVIYENQGNISLKPDLQLQIINIETGVKVFNVIFPYPDTETPVKPGERKTISSFEWQTVGQAEGKYRAETKTLLGGKTVEENTFRFSVGNVATVNNENTVSSNNKLLAAVAMLGRGNLMYGWFVIGGFLLFIALFLTLITKIITKRREI